MHRKLQLGSSITPSHHTNFQATTLLTNISFVCWADVIRQEYRATDSNSTANSIRLHKRVLGPEMSK